MIYPHQFILTKKNQLKVIGWMVDSIAPLVDQLIGANSAVQHCSAIHRWSVLVAMCFNSQDGPFCLFMLVVCWFCWFMFCTIILLLVLGGCFVPIQLIVKTIIKEREPASGVDIGWYLYASYLEIDLHRRKERNSYESSIDYDGVHIPTRCGWFCHSQDYEHRAQRTRSCTHWSVSGKKQLCEETHHNEQLWDEMAQRSNLVVLSIIILSF